MKLFDKEALVHEQSVEGFAMEIDSIDVHMESQLSLNIDSNVTHETRNDYFGR